WRPSGIGGGRGQVARMSDEDGQIDLIPTIQEDKSTLMVQHYWLDAGTDNISLFTCYPALRVHGDSQPLDDVKKFADDQIIQIPRPLNKPLRYTVESLPHMTPVVAAALERELQSEEIPKVVLPDKAIPHAAEIMQLCAPMREGLNLENPRDRYAF